MAGSLCLTSLFLGVLLGTAYSLPLLPEIDDLLQGLDTAVVIAPNGERIAIQPNDNRVTGLENTCNYYASNSDLDNLGIREKAKHLCHDRLGHWPDDVQVNADGFSYKACLIAKEAIWSGLTPVSGVKTVAQSQFNNSRDTSIVHTFSLKGTSTESLAVSTTNTVSLSTTVSYSVTLEKVFTDTFAMTASFTSSQTNTRTDSHSMTYTDEIKDTIPPHTCSGAKIDADEQTYSSNFRVPLCMDGYFRCQFPDRVDGHYFWYMQLSDLGEDLCVNQRGHLGSALFINSRTKVYDC